MSHNLSAESPNRVLRNFIRTFGRVRLSDLYRTLIQGDRESDVLEQFSINTHQLAALRSILIQDQPKRKHG
jgi:hypothetical protein